MAKKKAETVTQPAPTIVVQPNGAKVSHIFSPQFDMLALAMYENTLPEADKAKLTQQDIDSMSIYVRQGIIQLDMPPNNIQLNDVQKKVRELWFKDSTEDAVREQVLGTERFQYWKETGNVEPPPPKKEEEEAASPASENKGESNSTINVEINANDGEKKEEENTMFNQQNNNNGQQVPNQQQAQQQNQGNFITDAIGAVDSFTDHWYGKAAIAGAAAAGTYYLMNKAQNSDPDYSSAGDDAMAEFGGNFF